MLVLEVPMVEGFDEASGQFVASEVFRLELEHSLASLSKWEQREEKPFLGPEQKTAEETFRYIKDMVLTPDVPDVVFEHMTPENVQTVNKYLNAKMTATWFAESGPRRISREIITAEIIYFWMVSLQIPFECQYWHLNRLITLVRVCNEKNKPQQKTNRRSATEQRRMLNQQRRQQYGTTG